MEDRDKYLIVLRGGPNAAAEADVPYVVASTDRRQPGTPLRRFEVSAGAVDGFNHDTVIDCRWVYTMMKTRFPGNTLRFRLSPDMMQRVSIALVVGLQMAPPAPPPVATSLVPPH